MEKSSYSEGRKKVSEEEEMADKNKSGDFYDRPVKLGAWSGFKQFMWNSETSQFLGRTSGSWGEI